MLAALKDFYAERPSLTTIATDAAGKKYTPLAYRLSRLTAELAAKYINGLMLAMQRNMLDELAEFQMAAVIDKDGTKQEEELRLVHANKEINLKNIQVKLNLIDAFKVTDMDASPKDRVPELNSVYTRLSEIAAAYNEAKESGEISATTRLWTSNQSVNNARYLKKTLEICLLNLHKITPHQPGNVIRIAQCIVGGYPEAEARVPIGHVDLAALRELVQVPVSWTVSWFFHTSTFMLLKEIAAGTKETHYLEKDKEKKHGQLSGFTLSPMLHAKAL